MSFESLYLLKDLVIVLLLFALIGTLRKARHLQETLEQEKRKRSMPLINLEVNTDDDLGVFLVNDSYCYARNIEIHDLDVVADYGFKKHLTMKFPPLDVLKPSARAKLDYSIFNGDNDITSIDFSKILNHFADAPIKMRLHYENIEGNRFSATIGSKKGKYIIKAVTPIQK